MKRRGIVVCLLAVCLLALAFPTQAAAANPILIVTSSSNPFTTFLPEIVRTEGFNEFDTADISAVTSSTLTPYDLVILGDVSLTASQTTILSNWVNSGGNLIAMHPDPQLVGLLGLTSTGSSLSDAYVLMNTATGPGAGLVGQTIQFHGPAILYTLNGATSYATLYSSASTPTSNPAVTLRQAGSGQAAAFAYDLARSVVYTRQGNPAWSGQARDGNSLIRSDDLFFGGAQPDYVDFNKIQIPQADEQQRLLANLMLQMNAGKKPLPRFWYFPNMFKAVVIMTGDDHGSYYSGGATNARFNQFIAASPTGCNVANWECVRATAYLFPPAIASNPLTNAQAVSFIGQGFEVGVHNDSNPTCTNWTLSQLNSFYTTNISSFASKYTGVPAPKTHRQHCIGWSDYDSQPQAELSHGIRLDTSYYYWPDTWIVDRPGLFTGTGMVMRFATRTGSLLDIYQAATQMTDESGQSYPLHINTLLDNALSGTAYYGAFTTNMHADVAASPEADAVVASAKARAVPIVSSLQMLQWLDGRNGSSFGSLSWSGNVLSFSITVGANANNLRAMLPANFGSLGFSSLLLNNSPLSYQVHTLKGVQYAVFTASAGNYKATYGGTPLFSISGAITPGAVAGGTIITATGPVTVTASPDSYGNYTLSGLPSGNYTITPTKSGVGFTPTNQAVTVAGANVAAVNFNLVQTCPCSLWSNTTVPGTPSVNDNSAYEFGVRFRSDVAGTITGIRFYKSSQNTGTHTGTLWTNSGTQLATATFTGETASGWQQVNFAAPVAIAANTTYVASYHTATGFYAEDDGYFATSYDNAPLHAVQDGTGSINGPFKSGASGFPNSAFQSANYWVDVVFSPTAAFSISGTISGPGGSGATVTLSGTSNATVTADASGNYTFPNLANGPYTVTPSKPGFTFSPASQNATVNSANVTGINFSTVTYNISGTISGPGGSGATVNLTGTSSATTTADASGNFSFSNLANGSYTVTPSKSGFAFTPASQNVTVNNADQTGLSFNTVTYSISGTISGGGGSGATVNLTGTASATTTADASGNYSFSGLLNGSYTVTPSKSGFTFTPASQNATVNNSNITGLNFSTVTYSVSGTISGPGGNGATVNVTGTASASATADASGNYTVTGLANGSYTVTPSKSGFTFTPASQNVTVASGNVSGVNFGTVVQTYTLQGTISGAGSSGATVDLTGTSSATVTADASGNFTFTGLTNGSYTVTPSQSGFSFYPGTQSLTVNGANLTGVNFSSFQSCPCSLWTSSTVPGTASVAESLPVELGVRFTSEVPGFISGIRFYKGGANTGAHIGNLWTNTGTLLATATFTNETASGWQQVSFTPPVVIAANTTYVASYHTDAGAYSLDQNYFTSTFNNPPLHGMQDGTSGANGVYRYGASAFPTDTFLSANYWVDVVFNSAGAYGISGTISGPGGNGATVNLTGDSLATVTADASGNYTFSGLNNGSYTVTPSQTGFSFTPASQNATVNNASVTALNFSTVTYSISGTISGAGGNGATVNLTGTSTASVTADASGNYSFTGLGNGSYTVTPSKSGFTFTPTNQNATISNANVSAVNFSSAAIPIYTVSGTISGPGGSGAAVALSGTATASATADASGNYSFTGLAAGSYTVTPSKSGFVFTPASQNVTVTNADVTGVNFSTAVQTYTLQGTISGAGGNGATVTLSGTSAGTVTADASGNYSFTGLLNGSYTVTPSKTGFSYSPAAQPVTVNSANVTGVNFSSFQNCPCSLWTDSTVPGTVSANDPSAIELGVRFTSDVAGFITGIRFYKGSTNTGTHIGNLWTNTGTLLATATFASETASGWQQVSFSTPVAIAANTTYVASYHTTVGNYSYDQNYFNSAFHNPPLHGSQNGTGGANGAYLYGASAFPTNTFLASNYYVDVVFTAAQNISGTISGPGGSGATVNLTGAATATVTADASGNYTFSGVSNGSYTVTPSKSGFTFTPASQNVTVNNANVTGVNFSSAIVTTFSISGTISGPGGNGATVNLTGASTATVTADASGNYTFSNLNNGSYTVTPSKAGFTFVPVNQNVTVNNANVTAVNFTSAVVLPGPAIDKSVSTDNTTSSTTITSPTFTTTAANELLLAFVSADAPSTGTNTTVSGVVNATGGTLTWVLVRRTNTQRGTAEVWRAFAPAVLTNASVRATLSRSTTATITVMTFTGVDTSGTSGSGAIGATGTGNAATGAPTANLTTTRNGSWVMGVGTDSANGTSRTLGPNQTMVHQYAGSGLTGWVQRQNSTTAATGTVVTINDTAPTNDRYNLTIVEVLPVTGAGTTYNISGTISGSGGNAATVTLSGAASASVTADASGNYTFTGLVAGSYTVTPSKSGFAFTPASQNVTITNANVTGVNFSTVVQTYTLQGTIIGPGGNAATVNLTGASTASVTADASGNYTFSGLANGSYTVTPSKSGFTFNPASQPVTVNGANVTGVNFSALQNCPCSLWTGSTVPGTVSANDPFPVELGVRFTSDVAGSITGLRFYKGSTNTGTHIGNLWSNTGTLLATATFSNETASGWQQVSFASPVAIAANTTYVASYHTDVGNYSVDKNYFTLAFDNPPLHGMQDGLSGVNGAYVYGPTAFPTSTASSSNYYVDVVFATTGFSISGTISGPGGSGATVNLTGTASASVTADASGNYTFSGVANGSYTVTPSKSGFTFTPASQNVTVNNANVTAVNFSTVTYSISGTISGTGGNAATVNLTGTATATVTANASGAYTFSGLTNGSYTVTPSKSGFTFTPASQNVTVNNANVTAVNFSSASGTTFSISGTISGTGGNAATVNLTGTATATATADASGNYTFTGLANGSYTVTPSKSGFTFTPTNQAVTVNNANVTAVNFTSATAPTFAISGTISGTGGNAATVNLTGAATASVTADASGNYTFINLNNGSYTVTPSKSGFTFTPASLNVTVNNANVTGVNFTSAAGATGLAIDKTVFTDRSTNATTIVSPTFTTAAANELLLAFVATDGPSSGTNTTVSGVTGGSLTWALVRRTNTQRGTSEIWRAFAPAVLTNASVTATLSTSTAASITVLTFTGVDTSGTGGSGAIGATGTANAASGAPTASLTTTRNNSLVIGVGNDWDGATNRTVGANQTMVHQYLATGGDTFWVQRQTSTTPTAGTSVTINDTAPTADRYNLTICEVLPAP